jgi:hypothetical protein
VADEPHHHLVVENDWVRAYAVELGPRKSTLCHVHLLPYLMYVAGNAEIVSTPRQGEARKHHYLDMCCEFSPAGLQHVVENLAETPFRNLIFEVLPAAEQLRRPGLPFAGAAGVRMTPLYSGDAICAQLIELSSGAQTQVTGPAIVCSAYEDVVEFISPEGGTRKLDNFQQLAYVPKDSTGLVRCEAGQPSRIVVVTLGCE